MKSPRIFDLFEKKKNLFSQTKGQSRLEFGAIRPLLLSLSVLGFFCLAFLFFLVSGVIPQAKRSVPRCRHNLVFIWMPTDVAHALTVIRETTHDLPSQNVPNDDAARGAARVHVSLTRREGRREVTSVVEGKR